MCVSPDGGRWAYRRQSTATARAAQKSRMRSSPNLPNRSVSVPTETLSTESRLTTDGSGTWSSPGSKGTSLASPRTLVVQGATKCPPECWVGGVARQHDDRSTRDIGKLTPPCLGGADPSRRRLAKRSQVAPLVGLVEWVVVVGGIPGVDLGCSMTRHQGLEGLVHEGGVIQLRPQPPGMGDECLVDRRAHSYACHATTMPPMVASDKVSGGTPRSLTAAARADENRPVASDPAPVVIRPESPDDHDAIRRLVAAAFQSEAEAELVDRIRASGEYVPEMALVAEADGEIVGHVMISHAVIRNADGERRIVMLAPLAVLPECQGRGTGSALVRSSVGVAEQRGEPLVVVEGSPTYYGRLGFEHSLAHGIEIHLEDWAPPEAAQVIRLASFDPNDQTLRGKVVYPAAFDGME